MTVFYLNNINPTFLLNTNKKSLKFSIFFELFEITEVFCLLRLTCFSFNEIYFGKRGQVGCIYVKFSHYLLV